MAGKSHVTLHRHDLVQRGAICDAVFHLLQRWETKAAQKVGKVVAAEVTFLCDSGEHSEITFLLRESTLPMERDSPTAELMPSQSNVQRTNVSPSGQSAAYANRNIVKSLFLTVMKRCGQTDAQVVN